MSGGSLPPDVRRILIIVLAIFVIATIVAVFVALGQDAGAATGSRVESVCVDGVSVSYRVAPDGWLLDSGLGEGRC